MDYAFIKASLNLHAVLQKLEGRTLYDPIGKLNVAHIPDGTIVMETRSHFKKVFSSDAIAAVALGVESSSPVLDIPAYACGWRFGLALISTENPNFEMAWNKNSVGRDDA